MYFLYSMKIHIIHTYMYYMYLLYICIHMYTCYIYLHILYIFYDPYYAIVFSFLLWKNVLKIWKHFLLSNRNGCVAMCVYKNTFQWQLLFIQTRKLDVYFEYEEKIMSKSTLDKSLLDMISDPDGKCIIWIYCKVPFC